MKPIGELLSGQPVHTLSGSSTVLAAALAMTERRIGAILVTAENDLLIGIFTERDLMARIIVPGRDPGSVLLEEVMTSDLVISAPERSVSVVAQELQDRHIRHIPIVVDGHVVGILSLRDLLRAHLEVKKEEVDRLKAYIQGEEG